MKNIILYGADWCPDCVRVKDFLETNQLKYEFKNVDDGEAIESEMLKLTDQKYLIPTLIIDGVVTQNPDNDYLRSNLLEQSTDDIQSLEPLDVVMIGAGPAALSAAIYTSREDLGTLLIEKGVVGGLAAITDKVDNYPGFSDGIVGLELAENLRKQAERFGSKIELSEVTSLKKEGKYIRIETIFGPKLAKSVLIATGSQWKKLGIPGEEEFYGRGVHNCATCDGAFYRDKKLVVVGGGNSAAQEALFLTKFASHIDMLIRGDKFRASDVLIHEIEKNPKIKVHFNTTTDAIVGEDNKVTKVIGTNTSDNQKTEFVTDGVFVFIGLYPITSYLENSGVELDDYGFVKTNEELQTNIPGIFAAGDVRSGATMQIASAVGEGASAALSIRKYLEAN